MPTPTLFDLAMRQQFPRRSTWPFKASEVRRTAIVQVTHSDVPANDAVVEPPEVWPQPPVKSFRQIEGEATAAVREELRKPL